MGSLVNQKGGFYKTIEITRDSSNTSVTTLKEPMLKNTENYVCQVQSFITNISVTALLHFYATSLYFFSKQ